MAHAGRSLPYELRGDVASLPSWRWRSVPTSRPRTTSVLEHRLACGAHEVRRGARGSPTSRSPAPGTGCCSAAPGGAPARSRLQPSRFLPGRRAARARPPGRAGRAVACSTHGAGGAEPAPGRSSGCTPGPSRSRCPARRLAIAAAGAEPSGPRPGAGAGEPGGTPRSRGRGRPPARRARGAAPHAISRWCCPRTCPPRARCGSRATRTELALALRRPVPIEPRAPDPARHQPSTSGSSTTCARRPCSTSTTSRAPATRPSGPAPGLAAAAGDVPGQRVVATARSSTSRSTSRPRSAARCCAGGSTPWCGRRRPGRAAALRGRGLEDRAVPTGADAVAVQVQLRGLPAGVVAAARRAGRRCVRAAFFHVASGRTVWLDDTETDQERLEQVLGALPTA